METLLSCLGLAWLAALLIGASVGWGALAARWLGLPKALSASLGFGVFSAGGYAVFFAAYAHPGLGRSAAVAWLLASAAALALAWRRLRSGGLSAEAWLPAAAWLGYAAWAFALLGAFPVSSAERFTHWALQIDSSIPRLFAEFLLAGDVPSPMVGDWLSSDRPPLQTGALLALAPVQWGDHWKLNCEWVGALCQAAWLPALLGLAAAAGLRRGVAALAAAVCGLTGFALLNTVYVWPKLYAAALVLAALAVALSAARMERPRLAHGAAAGALAALGYLAHGGVAFTFVALWAWAPAWQWLRRARWGPLAACGLAFAALWAPWSAYQRWADPPGNRLVKWHLAGSIPPDARSAGQALREAYGSLTWESWRQSRAQNARWALGYPAPWGDPAHRRMRELQFFHHAPSLGFLVLGLPICFWRARQRPWSALAGLLALAVASLGAWVILMFSPGSALIHQGSYATTLLLFFCGAVGLARLPRGLGWPLLASNAALFAWAWVWHTPDPAPGALLVPEATSALIWAALWAWTMSLYGRLEEESPSTEAAA